MTDSNRAEVDHYGAQYSNFASDLYAEIRGAIFGVDIGQNGWLTAPEQDKYIQWLALDNSSLLLDVACGSGGPTLRIAEVTGCRVEGMDIHEDAVRTAVGTAVKRHLTDRASFRRGDASDLLPFEDQTFDGLICIDAINHLRKRDQVLREWLRVLKPGGRLVFTDPIVITGLLTSQEIAIRSSIGYFLFAARGVDEGLLAEAGFDIVEVEDRTSNMAEMAKRWHECRQAHEAPLRQIEGDETFEGQQEFFEVAARVAAERRLSRFAYRAIRPVA